tara:strand:+ start:117 stop:5324 length:5208 start_codon:yes stop_codon:yes gene_type:complete
VKYLPYIFLLLSFNSFSQNEGNIWYFGYNAGLDFNSGSAVAITDGALSTFEGCATICDYNGDLLFYTDGLTAYNKNHNVMQNGTNLAGHSSSTQSAVIIKQPGNNSIYYLFTVDFRFGTLDCRYSEIDINLDNGLGGIVPSTKNTLVLNPSCEKIAAIQHQNGIDYWIIAHEFGSNNFYSYLLSSAGLSAGIAYSSGSVVNLSANTIGYLRASPDGSRLASARSEENVELFNFNNTTGSITFEMTLLTYSGVPQSFYGLEFSPNGNLLYISNVDHANADLYQFNLAAGSQTDILNSQTTLGVMPGAGGALQLAPDGKIYNAQYGTGNNYLGVISNPDIVGAGCNYLPNSFYLAGKASGAGLPTFFSSIFIPPQVDTCIPPQANLPDTIIICNPSVTLTADQAYTYLWSTGETTQSIIVNQSGDYWVQVCDTNLGEVLVYENDFNSFIGSEWSDNTTSTYNSTTVLGSFNNASTTLNLSNLPTHNSIKAVFDLYLLDSWDGNAGPDIWDLSIDGSSAIITTFANTNFGGGIQSYPGNYPSTNASLTGVNQMGLPNICYTGINSISSLYKIDSPFSTHYSSSASIDFSASGLESACNESWAIDSVKIYVDSALSCCATEFVHVELTTPVANLGPDIITCDSLVTLTASAGYSYLWSTGDTTQSIIVDTTGNYQVITCDTFLSQQIIYESNFGIGIGPIWNTTSSFPINGVTALGEFGNQTISLSLNNILPHDSILVEFDLYVISSWDGNGIPICCGPDFITLRTDGIDMMHATFSNTGQLQSYPDDYPVNNPNQSGVDLIGANFSMYNISRTIAHSNSNAVIDFIGGPGLQSLGDESWAFSNVKIYTIFNECCATEDINVQIKCPLTTAIITEPSCNGYADASIDLTFVDGTLPQTVVWESSDNTFLSNMPNITNLIAGEYIVSTTCGLTCPPVIETIIVPEPLALIVPGIASDISCIGLNDGSVDITISALVPLVVSTEWTGPNSFASILEDINSLSAGMYSVLVTDANNCFITQDFEVQEPDSILPNPTIANVSCNGFSDGKALFSITGGTIPYNVNWGTSNPLNLYAGTHAYSITDDNSCVFLGEVIIWEPDPILPNPTTTAVLCNGDSTGTAFLSPTGGTSPYNINWGANNPSLLSAGLHLYAITDNNNCIYPGVVNIFQPGPIVVSPTQQNVSCYGYLDGWCTISIIGGIPNYTVDWYGAYSLSLSSGTYLYSVSDANNCILTDSVTITQPDSLKVTYITTDVQCYEESTGNIDVSVLLVNPPYSYVWTNTTNLTFIETTEDISNLDAGTYLLTVTDADLCAIELQIVVSQPTPISEHISIQFSNYTGYNIACKGENSGWISVEASGGYIPFTYAWNTGETTDSISNLYAGIYTLIITDGLGCIESFNLNLSEPDTSLTGVIQATSDYNGFNISCFNGIDGGIREIPIGGVSPYTWFWDGIQGSEYVVNKSAGYHNVELYDDNNCLWENDIILTEPTPLFIQNISVTDTCDRSVGEININVSGGIFPYTYLWSSGQNSDSIKNLKEGSYTLTSIDANLCEISESISVLNIKNPEADFHTYPQHKRYYNQLENPFLFIDISNTFFQKIIDWQWDFGDNYLGKDSISSHSYAEIGEYTILLTIETEYNCWDTISKKVLIDEYDLYIPNAFTPFTGDVLNDEFKAYGYGIRNYTMKIYNRWGGIIFESDNINIGWDGTINDGGTIAQIGIYIYYIAVENIYGEIFKYEGKLNLIR